MAMPASTFDGQNAWAYEAIGALPLPGPALVIDTRQFENQLDFDPMALLVYLWNEMYDISREMRQQNVESWSNVHTFLGFRKLNRAETDEYLVYDPRSWEPGQLAERYTGPQLASQLGLLVNELRNQRLACARPDDPNQGMVRVIFLVDLADQEPEMAFSQTSFNGRSAGQGLQTSFGLALTCAGLLKAWFAHEQGFAHDESETRDPLQPRPASHTMLQTVAICLNTQTSKHAHLLRDVATVYTLDMLILVQSYRQDYGYLDLQAQVSHAELLLSALLLHWPQAMLPDIEDGPDAHQAPPAYRPFPRPVYILGSAAIEHASRWGKRWWSYGLETALLEKLLDSTEVEKQGMLHRQVQDWWTNWRTQVQWVLGRLTEHPTPLAALRTLRQMCPPRLSRARSLSDLREQIETFIAGLRPFYREPVPGSLRELLASAPWLVELDQQLQQPPDIPPALWSTYLEHLRAPQREAQVCLLELFLHARGSIPRALRHLQLLEEHIAGLRNDISRCDLQALLDEWNRWYIQTSERLTTLERHRPRSKRQEKHLALKEGASVYQGAQALQQKHDAIISGAVEAYYELALLERADMTRPYLKRLKEVQNLLQHIQKRSRYLRDVASLRLSLGTSKPLVAPWQSTHPAILPNRQDQMNQKELLKYFAQALDELAKENEPFALTFLAQGVLRFLGPQEPMAATTHGRQPEGARSHNDRPALQHLQVLEILLVSAFLATRAGANLATMEPLLANYRRALVRLQPAADQLSQTIQDMEELVRFVSIQKKMYGNDVSSTLAWKVPDELPLAALIAGQPRDGESEALLRSTNLLRYLETSSNEAASIVQKLDQQSTPAGFPDTLRGDEMCYLYLPAGWEVDAFAQALHVQLRSTLQIVRTPNIEKMIYLRVHRIYHF
jgi:hypothetical protein